jgi:hypothetical protein
MAATTQETKEKTFNVKFEDVVLDAKYNPALFLPSSRLGMDATCQSMINRGMESAEVRRLIQRDLLAVKSYRCSDLFSGRNMKSTDFKLSKLDTCSYCGKQCDQSNLLLYFTIAHADDELIREILKRNDEKTRDSCALKHVTIASLETKIRDVRSQEPFVVNRECALLCLARCADCMIGEAKIEVLK